MQVLMEVLDSGQYLPYGATKKRMLQCAVIMASNRSWEALRNQMHLDEYARLGTTVAHIQDLSVRREDLIAVLSTSLAGFAEKCTTWTPPEGLTPEAWDAVAGCPWRGNLRTLIRVTEAASISHARKNKNSQLIPAQDIQEALSLWEPEAHPSSEMYASYGNNVSTDS